MHCIMEAGTNHQADLARMEDDPMLFYVDPHSGVPIFRQLMDQVKLNIASGVLKPGDEVEAKFVGVDRKNRTISLSIKQKDRDEETAAIKGYSRDAAMGTATLGDIIKEQMGKD